MRIVLSRSIDLNSKKILSFKSVRSESESGMSSVFIGEKDFFLAADTILRKRCFGRDRF